MTKSPTPEQIAQRERYDANTSRLKALIQPISGPIYTVDHNLAYIETALASYAKDWGMNLDPDYQRGHVWSDHKRSMFIESLLRGTLPDSLLMIQFNAPHWDNQAPHSDLPSELQIVDGLQRLTTVRRFMAGELTAFGLHVDDFNESSFDCNRFYYRMKFAIHAMQTRADVLRYYLAINRGGVVHSDEEIARVTALLQQAEQGNA